LPKTYPRPDQIVVVATTYLRRKVSIGKATINGKSKEKKEKEKRKNIQQSGFACGHPPYY
jgi:hypothetical protein